MKADLSQRNGELIVDLTLDGHITDIDLTAVTDRLDVADGAVQITTTNDRTVVIAALPTRSVEPA